VVIGHGGPKALPHGRDHGRVGFRVIAQKKNP
jgi:hypothetical protein